MSCLLGALTFALSGYRLKKPTRTLQIKYEDVTGIKVHSEVRYAGAPAGRVIAMRHLTPSRANEIVKQTRRGHCDCGIGRRDSAAAGGCDGNVECRHVMLAPKFVALSAGTPGGKTLANNAAIEGHPAYGIEQITAAAGPLFENANKLFDNLNLTVTDVKGDLGEFMPKIGPLADTLKTDVDNLQNVVTSIQGVCQRRRSLFSARRTHLSGQLTKRLQDQMKELHIILLNLKVVTTHAKALVESLGEKPNRLIFSGKATQLTPEDEIIKSSKPLPAKKP